MSYLYKKLNQLMIIGDQLLGVYIITLIKRNICRDMGFIGVGTQVLNLLINLDLLRFLQLNLHTLINF